MLITESSRRDAVTDQKLAVTLALIAGALNAAAFYAVGFFSANMTGNVSSISDRLATGSLFSATLYFGIVIAFIIGAAFCGALLMEGGRRGLAGAHAFAVLIEGILLMPLSLVDLGIADQYRIPILAIWLAFLMGLQNAVVTHLSNARVRTTHVSGMATDLGIELALAWYLRRGAAQANVEDNYRRLRLHLSTILAFLIGGVAGVMVYRIMGGYGFLVASGLLCLMGLRGIRAARQQSRSQVTRESPLPPTQ